MPCERMRSVPESGDEQSPDRSVCGRGRHLDMYGLGSIGRLTDTLDRKTSLVVGKKGRPLEVSSEVC